MNRRWNLRRLAQLLALIAVVGLAVLFREPLLAWFTGAPDVESEPAAQGELPRAGDVPKNVVLSPPALEYVRAAFGAYEAARAQLADDELKGLDGRANELAKVLRAAAETVEQKTTGAVARESGGAHDHGASEQASGAHEGSSARAQIVRELRQAAEQADQLASSRQLDQARVRFAGLSEALIALAAVDPRLQEGFHVFSCPMVEGFNKWLQRSPQLDNPYMGTRMPACGSESAWQPAAGPAQDDAGPTEHTHGAGEVSHYTCPMHPAIREPDPGQCPICGMDLTPVTRAEVESGVITVDPGRRQVIGIKTAKVAVAPLVVPVRALGVIAYDETKLVDVTLKLDGYIHELKVDATGEPVKQGDVLFTLYSPELYAAQEEYLLALASESAGSASLVRASERRLSLWGLTKAQIATIAARGEPIENVPFLSPASGYVLEKNVVEGGAVRAGERLFRIVPLKTVWVEADVYEQDLAQVKVGQPVRVTLPYMPGQSYDGRVAYVYPTLDKQTRTGKVRIELPNRELTLKPDMYADVRFEVKAGDQLQVPESAVLYTGPRTLVFVDLGEGRLRPQPVKLGRQGEDGIEVLEGLAAGDVVVTSGNFLIAAESRIRSSADYWSGGDDEAQ